MYIYIYSEYSLNAAMHITENHYGENPSKDYLLE